MPCSASGPSNLNNYLFAGRILLRFQTTWYSLRWFHHTRPNKVQKKRFLFSIFTNVPDQSFNFIFQNECSLPITHDQKSSSRTISASATKNKLRSWRYRMPWPKHFQRSDPKPAYENLPRGTMSHCRRRSVKQIVALIMSEGKTKDRIYQTAPHYCGPEQVTLTVRSNHLASKGGQSRRKRMNEYMNESLIGTK